MEHTTTSLANFMALRAEKIDALIDAIIDLEEVFTGGLPEPFINALQRANSEKVRLESTTNLLEERDNS